MHINGITVTEGSDSVVLALNNGIEKIVIKSDFKSLENYAAQRKIEEKVYLKQRTQGIPNVDADNLPIWGMEKKTAGWIRKAGSVIADFIPYVGTSKAVSELIFGYDYIGGEEISRVVAACAVVGSLVPVPGAAKGMKYVAKWVNRGIQNAPDLMKKMPGLPTRFHMRAPAETEILRKEFRREVRSKFIKEYSESVGALKRFSENERQMLRNGKLPDGWIVHHKKPLYRGGNNAFSNLRIMKETIHNKYRTRLHHYEKGKNIYGLD